MSQTETPTDLPAAPTGTCPRCGGGNTKYRPAEVFCRTCDRAFTATGTDAGVAELIERLRTKLAVVKEAQRNKELSLWVPEHHASWNDIEECVDALAQQATQLQEARQALDATEEEMELFKAHAFRLADELEAAKSQLISLRAELETLRGQYAEMVTLGKEVEAELETAQQAHETALEAVIRERDAEHMELLAAQQAMRDAIVSMAISNYSTAENLLAAALAPTND